MRVNPQGFTDLIQKETENILYKNFTTSYYGKQDYNTKRANQIPDGTQYN